MSSNGFIPSSQAFSSNTPYQDLAQQRPTVSSHTNLGDAFMESDLGSPFRAKDISAREHLGQAILIEKKALALLNDTSRPIQEILIDAARYIKAAKRETQIGVDASGKLNHDIDPILALSQSDKWFVPVADASVVEIPDFMQDQRAEILDTAAALNDFHGAVNEGAKDAHFLKANLLLKKKYPKLVERLEQLKQVPSSPELEVIIEYLKERTDGWQNPEKVSTAEKRLHHDGLDDMVSRAALYYGLPVDLSVELAKNFVDTDLYDPFSRIPIIDTKEGHLELAASANSDSQLDDLQPSYDLFGNTTPLNIIDAVRIAMLENAPSMNLNSQGSTFYRSLTNLNDAQGIHYDDLGVDGRLKEPHFMGSGAWAELRAGMAMIKLQAHHESLLTDPSHDKSREPRLVVGVMPCIDKKYFDNAGVDYWIKTVSSTDGKPVFEYIPIQIKSSQRGVNNYYRKGNQNLAVSIKTDGSNGPARAKTLSKITDEIRAEVANPRVILSEENYLRLNEELDANKAQKTNRQINDFRKARNLLINIIKGTRSGSRKIT